MAPEVWTSSRSHWRALSQVNRLASLPMRSNAFLGKRHTCTLTDRSIGIRCNPTSPVSLVIVPIQTLTPRTLITRFNVAFWRHGIVAPSLEFTFFPMVRATFPTRMTVFVWLCCRQPSCTFRARTTALRLLQQMHCWHNVQQAHDCTATCWLLWQRQGRALKSCAAPPVRIWRGSRSATKQKR